MLYLQITIIYVFLTFKLINAEDVSIMLYIYIYIRWLFSLFTDHTLLKTNMVFFPLIRPTLIWNYYSIPQKVRIGCSEMIFS